MVMEMLSEFGEKKVLPPDNNIKKGIAIGLAMILMAVAVSVLSMAYVIAGSPVSTPLFGMFIAWLGSFALFYAVITEEHTINEFFLRKAYFTTGFVSMVVGEFFTFFGVIYRGDITSSGSLSFGSALFIFGFVLIMLSSKRHSEYSKNNALFCFFAGVLLFLGGMISLNKSVTYSGLFVMIFGVIWLGLIGSPGVAERFFGRA